MRIPTLALKMALVTICTLPAIGGESPTIFRRQFSSSIPEIQKQLELQKQGILTVVNAGEKTGAESGFGFAANEVRVGLVILEPQATTTARIYAAVVLRNESLEPIKSFGIDSDVIEVMASGGSGQALKRTWAGEFFSGPDSVARKNMPRSAGEQRIIPAGGQVVYEINIGDLFEIPPDQPVTISAVARPRGAKGKLLAEVRSQSVAVIPKVETGARSIYDKPVLPEWAAARVRTFLQTNLPVHQSNVAIKMANAMTDRTNAPFYSNYLANVRSNQHRKSPETNGSRVLATTRSVTEPTPPSGVERVGRAVAPSHTKYYLAGIVLALLAIGGFLVRRR